MWKSINKRKNNDFYLIRTLQTQLSDEETIWRPCVLCRRFSTLLLDEKLCEHIRRYQKFYMNTSSFIENFFYKIRKFISTIIQKLESRFGTGNLVPHGERSCQKIYFFFYHQHQLIYLNFHSPFTEHEYYLYIICYICSNVSCMYGRYCSVRRGMWNLIGSPSFPTHTYSLLVRITASSSLLHFLMVTKCTYVWSRWI